MPTIEERIKTLDEKREQLKKLKQKQDAAKKAVEAKKARTAETRKKVLVGAMMLEHMSKNETTKANIMGKLNSFLSRPDDRALFDLPAVYTEGEITKALNEAK